MKTASGQGRIERAARLRWVLISEMRVSEVAQRAQNQARVDRLAADFDLEQLGTPEVNFRDGAAWIIAGAHRIAALRQIGYGDQRVQCWTYDGLTEQEEAERFLLKNDFLAVSAFDKYRIGVNAGREVECDIDRIVRSNGCVVSRDAVPGAIAAVGTITRIYKRAGGPVLGRTVRIARDAYGDPGLDQWVLDGISHLCHRYNGTIEETVVVEKLSAAAGGVNGLLGNAEIVRRKLGAPKGQSVAAAAVEIINRGRGNGGKKLPGWWS
ncbi:MAG: DUF6551 family protein [Pseudonocardiaceae bacterium]